MVTTLKALAMLWCWRIRFSSRAAFCRRLACTSRFLSLASARSSRLISRWISVAVVADVLAEPLVDDRHLEERVEQAAELLHLLGDELVLQARVVLGQLVDLV